MWITSYHGLAGGTDHLDNLQLLCSHCNRLKGNRTQEYLLVRLAGQRAGGAALLEEVCASDLFSAQELPAPTDEERRPPRAVRQTEGQIELPTTEPK